MSSHLASSTTIVVVLPFERPTDWTPPLQTQWDDEKESILHAVLEKGGGAVNVDWNVLSETLETPVPILLVRARKRYAEQLKALGQPMPSSSTARSTADGPTVTGDLVGVRSDATQQRFSTTSSGEGRGKEDLYRQHSPSILPSRLASAHPIPAAQPISIIQSSPRPNPSVNSFSRSSTSYSSSRSSSSSSSYSSPFHDNGDRPASSSDPITAISTQLQNLASLGGGAFALPSSSFPSSSSSHPPTSTVTPRSNPSNRIASGDGDKDEGGGSSARRQGSSTSSFSDLSNASLSQDAIEEAALSQFNRSGASRLSMFSRTLR